MTIALAACVPRPQQPETQLPAAFDPKQFTGGSVYTIIPQASEIRVLAFRDGPLARLGHNHVISNRSVSGKIYRHPQLTRSGAIISVPVTGFTVDEPELRREAGEGFESTPTSKDVEGTRQNMLGEKLLDVERYPEIQLRSVSVSEQDDRLLGKIRIVVKNVSQDVDVALQIVEKSPQLWVIGHTQISQTSLGLTPFSILMGAIAVRDVIDIQFRFVAQPEQNHDL